MSPRQQKFTAEFDSGLVEHEALRLARAALETQSLRAVAERCEVSHTWLSRWVSGEFVDPGIHRIGRVIERLS